MFLLRILHLPKQLIIRLINRYLKWEQEESGKFRKSTSHMMKKFFNTQLINASMPEEIQEHMMGHKYHDPVRAAHIIHLTLKT
ncbi:hypothetical protein BK008_09430 [Methanobacterium sp. MZ-A1]|jgi:intergrase/recombinase|uniref:Uncharacterized protein n=1 Tax=Methanobacterium subterraneum TaxID=59277 RepID=A0A2H4VEY6_9EURY|nr:hypothetical protein BK007_11990 [Methanobacterium subterraneum]AUB58510.1 hypothetical protein BK008_09430 [Methanobacterium sp. MZ-A1]AUB59472.1 hypothetical protein BK009_01495 [Methanobacterium subterraneum]